MLTVAHVKLEGPLQPGGSEDKPAVTVRSVSVLESVALKLKLTVWRPPLTTASTLTVGLTASVSVAPVEVPE